LRFWVSKPEAAGPKEVEKTSEERIEVGSVCSTADGVFEWGNWVAREWVRES